MNRITEAPHIHKMLELPYKQGSMMTKFIHFEGIISNTHKRLFVLGFNSSVNNEVMSSRSVNSGLISASAQSDQRLCFSLPG